MCSSDLRSLDFGHARRLGARIVPLAAELRDVARAHGATPVQVALAWVLHHPSTVAIPGARTVAQLEENAAAADLVLAPDDVERLTGRPPTGLTAYLDTTTTERQNP